MFAARREQPAHHPERGHRARRFGESECRDVSRADPREGVGEDPAEGDGRVRERGGAGEPVGRADVRPDSGPDDSGRAPPTAPVSCATRYAAASPGRSPCRVTRAASDTTGLKCAADTGASRTIRTARPSAVAVLFSSSCSPTSAGERREAMTPEPTTMATSRPVPRNSASRRVQSDGGRGMVVVMARPS